MPISPPQELIDADPFNGRSVFGCPSMAQCHSEACYDAWNCTADPCLRDEAAKPKALDLFCCAGGAGMGLQRAGFSVVGVDIEPQPRYPFSFVQADALTVPLDGYDFIWASPPCQRFCALRTRENLTGYPDLIEPIRARLLVTGKPFVIENVSGAPVRSDLMLCGTMFGLRSYRHRHFECSFPIEQPEHPKHIVRVNRRGENRRRHWDNGGFITITGDVGTYCGPEAMGIDWMTGNEMSEAIPPAYAEFIGRAVLAHIEQGQNEARRRDDEYQAEHA